MNTEKQLQVISLILLVTLSCIIIYLLQGYSTPIENVHPKNLIEIEAGGRVIGSYLWVNRSQEVVVQAFVLFAAAISGLLFFKAERW